MKPHPRIRKAVKWGGAAVTVLLVGVWVGSGWWYAGWHGEHRGFTFASGALWLEKDLSSGGDWERGAFADRLLTGAKWDFWFHPYADPQIATLGVPLWALAVPTLLATAAAWRLDALARRLARAGACPKCRYDRTGLAASAKCPECGAAA